MSEEEKEQHKLQKQEERKRKRLEKKIAYYAKKKEKEESGKKNIFQQFKAFISRGSVIDMAVGVILATSFTAIVNSLVNNIFMPLINAALHKVGMDYGLTTVLTTNPDGTPQFQIEWSIFINAIISFLLIALILFGILKIFQTVKKMKEKAKIAYEQKLIAEGVITPPEPEPEPEEMATTNDIIAVLHEIRDSLKDKPKK